ncbi:acylglycerol kinase, mitochondrial [Cylas formicarius]|uniref:acylglycerol kinase, mitochondrial n=1 Tax=Cylas formicarius TaxID=197179 RepID=UPI002958466A|nr:acylglycerol kinase, mitochondrial [Cylas formicarius]
MSIFRSFKIIRENWKKSTFAVVVITWGVSYTKNYLKTDEIMKSYCEKAALYGKGTISVQASPRSITVILNPNANKRKAATEFEKFCAPLLNLAGLSVEVIKTESEGHAKNLMETLGTVDSIVVAGGDGTLSEVVTGLLRRTNENSKTLIPLGVLPLGLHNTVGRSLFPGEKKIGKIKSLADATMAVIEETMKPMDVMKIEILNEEENKKPVYAVAEIKWGAYRDAEMKKERYWYFGGLKKYATYLFSGLKSSLTWECQAQLLFSPPCTGCSNCHRIQMSQLKSKWFQRYMKEDENELKFKQIHNPQCLQKIEKAISTTDLTVFTSNVIPSQIKGTEVPKLQVNIGPEKVDYLEFVKQGWKSELGETRNICEAIEARTIEIDPSNVAKSGNELWFSIDNEDYEVKPIRVTLLPGILNMYCKKEMLK